MFRILLATLVCIGLCSRIQAQSGNVSVHADPRLALLINKSRPVERPEQPKQIAAVTPKKDVTKRSESKIPATRMADVQKDVNSFVAEKNIPVKNSSAAKSVKPSPEDLKAQHRVAMRGSTVGAGFKGSGYRVQIYNGTSREEAMRIKAEFMRAYPNIRTYFSFVSPHYRVKVGDFRRREDAMGLFNEANDTYKPCMIVPDAIGSR
jgi:hypothetical protein